MYRVVIAEDEAASRAMLVDFVTHEVEGFAVSASFPNGQDALDYVLEHGADAVISDIRMARMSGIELARALYERNIPVPVVIISGYSDFEYARQAVQYGVFNYILKPIDFDELRAALKKVSAHLDAARQTSRRSDEQIALFLTYVLAGLYTSPAELRRLARMIRFPLPIDGPLCRVLDIAPESAGEWDSESLIELIEDAFRTLGGEARAWLIHESKGHFYYVVPGGALPGQALADRLQKTLRAQAETALAVRLVAEETCLSSLASAVASEPFVQEIKQGIAGEAQSDGALPFEEDDQPGSSRRQIYDRAMRYIAAHACEDISREDAAQAVFVSQSYLSHIFQEVGGTSFIARLTELRMKRAIDLLSRHLSVNDVIAQTGYHSKKTFLANFRAHTGMTPSEYRQNVLRIQEDEDA